MGKTNKDDIVLLFDYFNTGSQDLLASFENADYEVKTVVINDDGFLPDSVENVFDHFLGDFKAVENCPGKPLYFNQIQVPAYWQISGTNNGGSVHDKSKERGRIFYAEPKNKRLVKVVDWLDEDGHVKCSDHYNKYGCCYARTIFNKKSQRVSKSYFDVIGREIIVENYVTGDIALNIDGVTKIFKDRTEFVKFYFVKNGLEDSRIFFNSLSVPFFVSNSLPTSKVGKGDILFWQEKTGSEIPGNMQMIFEGLANRCETVVAQNHQSYEKLLQLKAPKVALKELGYIYSFKKINGGKPSALICTNTENVEKLEELLKELPEVKFHVTALTEMSGKLLAHEKYDNVIMYPNIKMSTLENLFWDCDFFLDINHEGEIVDATRKAFIFNHVILAFQETSHGFGYTAPENIFSCTNYKSLVTRIKSLINDKKQLEAAINAQQQYALTASALDYKF
ncbi:MAG: accessory Sec system glycosylation chaperone GtfB [Pseudobutyrivibrio sp.]|nr:accessory Sec system glycosylation chaperone GtfB [Pseudobutyrivibrio sp.]